MRLPFKIGVSSLIHNTREIHQVLKQWAKRHIVLGTSDEWNAQVTNVERVGEMKHGEAMD